MQVLIHRSGRKWAGCWRHRHEQADSTWRGGDQPESAGCEYQVRQTQKSIMALERRRESYRFWRYESSAPSKQRWTPVNARPLSYSTWSNGLDSSTLILKFWTSLEWMRAHGSDAIKLSCALTWLGPKTIKANDMTEFLSPCPRYRPSGPGKTRTHCSGNIVSYDVARSWKNVATWLRADRTQKNVSEEFQKHFMCPGHKICAARYECCVRGKTSRHLGNMITSAMFPPQCFLVLPAP